MRRAWSLLIVILLLSGISYAVLTYLENRKYTSTDNAYTTGDIITVSSPFEDLVMWLGAEEGDYVGAGQQLARLDGGAPKNALSRAKSDLARAVQEVAKLKQKVKRRQAEVVQWQASYKLAKNESDRRQKLAKKGMVSKEEADISKLHLEEVAASLATAQQKLSEAELEAGDMPIAEHPRVRHAAAWASGNQAYVNKTTIVAPVSGHIAKRFTSAGDIVKAGKPMFQLVQLDKVWVEANFKETKLRHLRIGQPVEIVSDLYGEEVHYQGEIMGTGTGTGAAFSLLPAQNATGNWLKIVQRVPIRIALTDELIKDYPLPIGSSLHVKVDTSKRNGERLSRVTNTQSVDVSKAYTYWREGTREMADNIIAQHLPANARATTSNEVVARGNATR